MIPRPPTGIKGFPTGRRAPRTGRSRGESAALGEPVGSALDLVEAELVLGDRATAGQLLGPLARGPALVEALAALIQRLEIEPDLGILGRQLGGALELRKRRVIIDHQRQQPPIVGARHAVVGVRGDRLLEVLQRLRKVALFPGLQTEPVEGAGRFVGRVLRRGRLGLRELRGSQRLLPGGGLLLELPDLGLAGLLVAKAHLDRLVEGKRLARLDNPRPAQPPGRAREDDEAERREPRQGPPAHADLRRRRCGAADAATARVATRAAHPAGESAGTGITGLLGLKARSTGPSRPPLPEGTNAETKAPVAPA